MKPLTNHPKCSVVLCTLNRCEDLRSLLTSLKLIVYPSIEIVVVAGPSVDGTAELLKEYGEQIKVVNTASANISVSRNLGIEAASGEVVVFIDDDAQPGNVDWLENLVKPLTDGSDPRCVASSGGVINGFTGAVEYKAGLASDYCHQAFTDDDPILSEKLGVNWFPRLSGGNSAYRRDILLELGGFDGVYKYYADEVDVSIRILNAGYTIAYVENAEIMHHPGQTVIPRSNHRNLFVKTVSDTYFCLKNGQGNIFRRIWKTLVYASGKRYIRPTLKKKMPSLAGKIRKFREVMYWVGGLATGYFKGLFFSKRLLNRPQTESEFVPYPKTITGNKQRICFIGFSFKGANGVARYTYELIRGYRELGHEVHIITCSNKDITLNPLMNVYEHRITMIQLPFNLLKEREEYIKYGLGFSVAMLIKLAELAEEGITFDVIEAVHGGNLGVCVKQADIAPVVSRLVTMHREIASQEQIEVAGDLEAQIGLEKWYLENVDGLITSTEQAKKNTVSLLERDPAKSHTTVIPYGIVPAYKVAEQTRNKRKVLLYVGKFIRRKGTDLMFDIIPQLLQEYPEWEIHLVGQSGTPVGNMWLKDFKETHKKAPWYKRYVLLGLLPDPLLRSEYQFCDLFVAPSRYESFGLVYLEAMQFGKACIGSNVGGIPEVIVDGETGLLAKPGDAQDLYQKLTKLMSDSDERARLGAAGKERFEKRFHYTRMVESSLSFYADVKETWEKGHATSPHKRAREVFQPFQGADGKLNKAALRNWAFSGVISLAEDITKTKMSVPAEYFNLMNLAESGETVKALDSLEADGLLLEDERFSLFYVNLLIGEKKWQKALEILSVMMEQETFQKGEKLLECHALYAYVSKHCAPETYENTRHYRLNERVIKSNLEDLMTTAIRFVKDNKPVLASVFFEKLLEEGSSILSKIEFAQVHYHLASALLKSGDRQRALELFLKILKTRNISKYLNFQFTSGIHFHLGKSFYESEEYELALSHFQSCIEMNGNHREAIRLLGETRNKLRTKV